MRVELTTGGVSLHGRTALLTGATSGIGRQAAIQLARLGATVILSGRREERGREIASRICADQGAGAAHFLPLDLSDLAHVRSFADRIASAHDKIDILVNNAGILALPERTLTADGFEAQFGTNYVGHFALTARLLPLLLRSDRPRVVNISSISHHVGRIRLDDLQLERGYRPWRAYAQSKLAMLMFALELQRRSERSGWNLLGLAAHPGLTNTELAHVQARSGTALRVISQRGLSRLSPLIGQSPANGARPTVVAAAADVPGGSYIGPARLAETRGFPTWARVSRTARDERLAGDLWRASEAMTGLTFPGR